MVRHYWHNLGFSFKSVLRDQEVQFNRSSAVLQSKHFSGLSGCANSNGHRVGQAYHELQLCKARHMMKIVPLTLKVAACKKLRQGWGTKKSRNTESTTSAVRGLKACLKLACSYHIACVVFFSVLCLCRLGDLFPVQNAWRSIVQNCQERQTKLLILRPQ